MEARIRHQPSFAVARLLLAPGEHARVEAGAMMATSYGVAIQVQAQGGWVDVAAARVGFAPTPRGHGPLLVGCYGAQDVVTLRHGEMVTIDLGPVVAYADTVQWQTHKVASAVVQSLKSGEGLVFDFAGPGQVLTQTRNPSALVAAQVPRH